MCTALFATLSGSSLDSEKPVIRVLTNGEMLFLARCNCYNFIFMYHARTPDYSAGSMYSVSIRLEEPFSGIDACPSLDVLV